MKWLPPIGVMLAFAGLTASCNGRQLAEDNTVRTDKPSKPLAPKCSVQNPLACKSSGILLVSPDFVAELDRFVGTAEFDPNSVEDPRDYLFGPGDPSVRPQPLESGVILLTNCRPHECEKSAAALLRNNRIVALAIHYDGPPYGWEGSDEPFSSLDIFIDRLTPESEKWIEILRSWGPKGKKVRVHELSVDQTARKSHSPR